MIQSEYGEGFLAIEPLGLSSISAFL